MTTTLKIPPKAGPQLNQSAIPLESADLQNITYLKDYPVRKKEPVLQLLPEIKVVKDGLFFNGKFLDLAGKKLTLRLFNLYFENPFASFTRDQLIEAVYKTDKISISPHQMRSKQTNIIKLISRSRAIADEAICPSDEKWIEWFCYNVETRRYSFYRLDNQYIQEKQQMIKDYFS